MRIALVADTVNSAIGAGGAVSGQRLVNLLRQNHEVTVISADSAVSSTNDVKLRGFQPSVFAVMKHGYFKLAWPNRKLIRKALSQVDVVHLQFPFWLSFVALQEARKLNIPVMASFHVQPENVLHNIGVRSPWLNRKLYKFWVKKLWNRSDLVLCPTEFAAEKLRQYKLKSRTVVISNGAPTVLSPAHYEREPDHKGYFLIFMLGRLASEKRQDVLIEAVRNSKYRDRIKIVIGGMGHCEKKLRRMAKSLPNGADISYIPEERKHRMFATADLFVHCSEVELEGMAVLESMRSGLPVLVADGPETASSRYALEKFRFPVGDVKALTAKIDWLIENPKELSQAKEHYRALAADMSVEKCVANIEDAYKSLLKN